MEQNDLPDVFFFYILENKNLGKILLNNSVRFQKKKVLDSLVQEYFSIGVLQENDETSPYYAEAFKNFQYRFRQLNLKNKDEKWFEEYKTYLLDAIGASLHFDENTNSVLVNNGNGYMSRLVWKLRNFYNNIYGSSDSEFLKNTESKQ